MNNKTRIILLAAPSKAHSIAVGRRLRQWLVDRVNIIADNLYKPLDMANLPPADFIIALGGDGTILSTVRALGKNQIPVIGINMGKLGFLAEFSLDEFKDQLEQIINSDDQKKLCSHRIMLNCQITGPNRDEFNSMVVNEVAIVAGPPFRMIEVSISIDDEYLALCAGDGLIVATPTGSTAYNLSAGGPILASTIESGVITPLAAHSLNFRPIVIDLDKPVILRCRDNRMKKSDDNTYPDQKGNTAVAVIDGHMNTPLQSEDQVVVTRSKIRFMLVQNPQHSQWQLLNAKLHWGSLPNYNLS